MKKEYHRDTDSVWAIYEAGHIFDRHGAPAPYWGCHVVYTWSMHRHAYWVYSIQVIGYGEVDDKVTREFEVKSLHEVNRFLKQLKDMEACYKRVYGD